MMASTAHLVRANVASLDKLVILGLGVAHDLLWAVSSLLLHSLQHWYQITVVIGGKEAAQLLTNLWFDFLGCKGCKHCS